MPSLTISFLIPKFYGEGGVLVEDTCCSIVGWEQSDLTDVFLCLLYSCDMCCMLFVFVYLCAK